MSRIAVVALVVFGLAAAAQAQDVKTKAAEPVKKAPAEMVKPAVAPAVKTAEGEAAAKTKEVVKKEIPVKAAEAAGTVHEVGKMKKGHHHGPKKTAEEKGPDHK
jgi:hypothetical protein